MGHIVIERPGKIKQIAKDAMKGYFWQLCVGFLLYFAVMEALAVVLDQVFYNPHTYTVLGRAYVVNLSYIGFGFRLLIEGPLALGLATYCLHFFRSRDVDNDLVLSGFRQPMKGLAIALRIYLAVLVGSVLLVIPGFIAWFQRSQAFNIMADNPDLTPKECIQRSKAMMKGNKSRLFGLYFSFILWFILEGIAGGLILDIAATGVIGTICKLAARAINVPLNTFIHISVIVFYELAAENLVLRRKDDLNDSQLC